MKRTGYRWSKNWGMLPLPQSYPELIRKGRIHMNSGASMSVDQPSSGLFHACAGTSMPCRLTLPDFFTAGTAVLKSGGIMNLPTPMDRPKRVLIIQLKRAGDVIVTTPVIEALHSALPDAEIDFL